LVEQRLHQKVRPRKPDIAYRTIKIRKKK
jgi:hypothetical protein